jgi:hypothetical protein
MAESFGTEFTLVEVTSDDPAEPDKQMWVALAKPHQAVTLVLAAVPEGWTAEVIPAVLNDRQQKLFEELKLKHGEIYRIAE